MSPASPGTWSMLSRRCTNNSLDPSPQPKAKGGYPFTTGVVSPWERGPMLPLQAVPAGLHGQRSGHKALTNVPRPQAWLQKGAPVTRIRARET
ncbi:hypothetical protein D4764_12G0010700 [Takifugu flavidus]|uniref:Uncharacterized protein n=1 Tax=Takifugu flavidus TaxID=433684 RepID=A0A5C6PHE9_9TELE|nr:hypothetical protein D4764_12G0010700 [Takifugu flavidus]